MRSKLLILISVALSGALALLGGSQDWITFMLPGSHSVVAIHGHQVNAALSPIAIAVIASALALSIAGLVFRRVLGILIVLLGGGIVAIAAGAAVSPLGAASGRITELTGIAQGTGDPGVAWVQLSAWVWVTVAAGIVAVLLGGTVTLVSGAWATAGRKYDDTARSQPQESTGEGTDRISDWDALSKGEDPSEYFR